MTLLASLAGALDDELAGALAVRRRLRECPEVAGRERRTGEIVAGALGAVERVVGTGVLARAGPPGPAVAVRAELDAIEVEGEVLHACGHDAHMAALIALAGAARRVEGQLPAGLVAVFQPSEEAYPSGAAEMVRAGSLGGDVRALVAAHGHPDVGWGEVRCDAGVVNAASDVLAVTMVGRAGHVAYPDRARNPIGALTAFLAAVDAAAAGGELPAGTLATVSSVRAGGPENVIPATARATVALRAMDAGARHGLRKAIGALASGAAGAHGCAARLDLTEGEPPLVNDPALSGPAAGLLAEVGLARAEGRPSFGSDDFAYFGALGPLLMLFVGLDGAPGFPGVGLHDPRFVVPDEAVRTVALAMAAGFCAAS